MRRTVLAAIISLTLAMPALAEHAMVGVIGCSQTTNAWRTWEELGTGDTWAIAMNLSGGTVDKWARDVPDGDYWNRLEINEIANLPATLIWWQVCSRSENPGTLEEAKSVLAEINRRFPGIPVYVSPHPKFETPETCPKQDTWTSTMLVAQLVLMGLAERGPQLPVVESAWIEAGDGECHVWGEGPTAFANTLDAFWGQP